MEGPTPVSALIHAATLVTAGVYLIARICVLFELDDFVLIFITYSGSFTSILSALTALTQDDMKKVIAYSTCSQLGYMVCICGLSVYSLGVFHLINHGFFKALLFLGAGSIIAGMGGEQDLRGLGGLTKLLPVSYVCMLLSFFALGGFPFLSGFYSKDLIIELQISKSIFNPYIEIENVFISNRLFFWFGILTASLTTCYSIKVLFFLFWSEFNGFKSVVQGVAEGKTISFALGVLCVGSLFSGFILETFFFGYASSFFEISIFELTIHDMCFDPEFLDLRWKTVALR